MKKLLIIVDMQNDFISGVLKNDNAELIVSKINDRIDEFIKDPEYKSEVKHIILTQDTHYNTTYNEMIEGQILPIHCVKGTDGHKIDERIVKHIIDNKYGRNAWTIEKENFGYIDWLNKLRVILDTPIEYLENNGVEIELCGTCTSICVLSNAIILKALLPKCKISVNENLCACISEDSQRCAINSMELCQINIIR